ncbi:hypothetical protein ACHAQH_007742 [Verticillium albo-atrum]
MSAQNDNVLLVIGSGPGISRAVVSLFASESHSRIALISRSADRLSEEKSAAEQAARDAGRIVQVKTWPVDIADDAALRKTLSEVEDFGTPEVVFFNAARITNVALNTTSQWAIPQLIELAKTNPESRPSLLVTNSFLYKDPDPELHILNLTKAAQRTQTLSMAKSFAKERVHVGLVSVGGYVAETNAKLNPAYIATKVREMYLQSPEFQVDVEIVED